MSELSVVSIKVRKSFEPHKINGKYRRRFLNDEIGDFEVYVAASCCSRSDAFVKSQLSLGCTTLFPACYFSVAMPLRFYRLFLSCFIELSLLCVS
jgi:hypothetical protein